MDEHIFHDERVTVVIVTGGGYARIYQAVQPTKIFSVHICNTFRPRDQPLPCWLSVNVELNSPADTGDIIAFGNSSDNNDWIHRFSPPYNAKALETIMLLSQALTLDQVIYSIEVDRPLKYIMDVEIA